MKKKTELGGVKSDRRSFIRQIGTSLAIGLGVALIPTSQAWRRPIAVETVAAGHALGQM